MPSPSALIRACTRPRTLILLSSYRILSLGAAAWLLAPLLLSNTAIAQAQPIAVIAPATLAPTADAQASDTQETAPAETTPTSAAERRNNARDNVSRSAQEKVADPTFEPSPDHEVHTEVDNEADAQPPLSLPRIFFSQQLNPLNYLDNTTEEKAQGTPLKEAHDDTRTIRRRYALFTQRSTHVEHKQRSHELDDELHSTLEVLIQFRQDETDASRIDVTVVHAAPHVSRPASPLDIRVPSSGLDLHCWQQNFEVQCMHAATRKPIDWPQWATLDMNDWLPQRRVVPGARWRRNLPDPRVVGWLGDDSHQGHIRASLETMESGDTTVNDTSRIHVQGVIHGDGELKVYHRRESFPINGELDIQFDTEQSLLHRFAVKWDGGVHVEGLLSADKYRWTRQTHTTLRVTSSLEN